MSWAQVLADAVVVCHVAYVSFVVFGLVAIVLGLVFRRPWARNFWFRAVHLAMILVVAAEALAGIPCPLTVWERDLRTLAGQQVHAGDFIGYWAHRLIFFQAPPWVFTVGYCLFASAVVLTFVLGPPRRPGVPASRPA
jgi:hypothetical protein